MRPLQEKFQVITPRNDKGEDPGPWKSFEPSRDLRGSSGWQSSTCECVDDRQFNRMPPGMELANQCDSQQEMMPLVMAGESDVSKDTNPASFANGFTRRDMNGSDDCYTGEHVDHFYGDAGGFAERNNYLDRL